MYDLYKKSCENDSKTPLSSFVFRNIFNTPFNLHFHRPQTDTCHRCDKFKIDLESQSITEEERNTLLREKELHQRKAQAAHDMQKQDVSDCANDPTKREDIPPIHHHFYTSLRTHPEAVDLLENPDPDEDEESSD
ncbi:unnamed protein product [Acanthoscelides obtectus]|uniref:Uncharacterized protein n=1 Tax=Acanthoscelides obtectus TaxID=200917 RepID=A0A9P0MI20_ACAOB|nr:unnamed protein product [Acanthoscelides obtectus]CAK1620043.1 hypothetical protein AOBTE_LOCUS156 [Acanthoscelides obtectus]